MPWCEPCAKYLAPTAMNDDGSCPTCGRPVTLTDVSGRVTAETLDLKKLAGSDVDDARAPWHFKLLVGLLVIYLGWRVIQLFV